MKHADIAAPLQGRRLIRVFREHKESRLVRFLKDFAAYHRDLSNSYATRKTACSAWTWASG